MTTAPTTTATGPTTAGTAPATSTAPGTAGYGPQGIIGALKSLVADLSNSQVLSGTTSSSGLSTGTLSSLNSAFTKLVDDLNGTSAGGTTPATLVSTSTSPSSTSPATSTSPGTTSPGAVTPTADTSALQSFLTSFLADLQGSGASTLPTVGSQINTLV